MRVCSYLLPMRRSPRCSRRPTSHEIRTTFDRLRAHDPRLARSMVVFLEHVVAPVAHLIAGRQAVAS